MKQHGALAVTAIAANLIGLVLFSGASAPALADTAPQSAGSQCVVASANEAHALADVLYQQGAYQRAGECYQTAGESERANLAFTKAVGPASAATAQRASDQAEKAKVIAQRYKQALHLDH
jgi:hypothetical protein